MQVVAYVARDPECAVCGWLRNPADRKARNSIRFRIVRLRLGNLGDHKSVGGEVWSYVWISDRDIECRSDRTASVLSSFCAEERNGPKRRTSGRLKRIGPILSGDKHMAKRTVPYEEILYRDLQDPEEAAAYLTAALDDKSRNGSDVFLLALRDVTKARGIRQLAKDTHLSRESLVPDAFAEKAILASPLLKRCWRAWG